MYLEETRLVTRAEMDTERFRIVAHLLGEPFRYQRKLWEWVVIADTFLRRCLHNKAQVLGFAVGKEPLPSFFASRAVEVTATDHPTGDADWTETNQHAAGLEAVYSPTLVSRDVFDDCVEFRPVDMTSVPDDLFGRYDFVWSSCAFEHLGTLEAGMNFVRHAYRCLRPGGWMVHTTEFNAASDTRTLERGNIVLYRERDIRQLIAELRDMGAYVTEPNLNRGDDEYDHYVDTVPYQDSPHLKLLVGGYTTTSLALFAAREHGRPE